MTVAVQQRETLTERILRRPIDYLPFAALGLDCTLVSLAILLGAAARRNLTIFLDPADVASSLSIAGPMIAGAWLLMLAARGAYSRQLFGAGTDEYKRIISGSMLTAGLVGVGCYLAKFSLARGFFVLAFGIGVPLLILGRYLLRRAIHRARRRGAFHERALIAGNPGHIDELAAILRRDSWLGYEVAGAISDVDFDETPAGVPIVGTLKDMAGAVDATRVDVLFLADGAVSSARDMRQLAWDLESHQVQLIVTPSVTDVASERVKMRPVGGLPLIHIEPPRGVHAVRWAKRVFDVVGAVAILGTFAPLMLFAAARIKVHDHGAVLFRQCRVGRGGVTFDCLKFRSMVTDAEARLDELRTEQASDELLFKMKDDPRVTRPGQWLRRFSVDELPQLFNVLRGDMSLVGPRPPLLNEVARYDDTMHRRLRVRPGMTGLWQVSGRSDLTWEEAIRLDLYYVDNWSMLQDAVILFRTFRAVVRSNGAY